mmetsp:Transcript_76776/g.212121  ORF Transcript_76776/g.212121 Transcript_76776/m.212121 type:complete len:302 (+) Transcript_76776:210-1115(+)
MPPWAVRALLSVGSLLRLHPAAGVVRPPGNARCRLLSALTGAAAFPSALSFGISDVLARCSRASSPLVPQLGHRLREVHEDPPIINDAIVHLEVCLLAVLHVLKGDERILQRVSGLPVADNLAAFDWPETREDQLQVSVLGDRIQLGDEEVGVGRCDVGVWQVVQQLKRRGLAPGKCLRHAFLQLCFVLLVLDFLEYFIFDDLRRLRWNQWLQAIRVREWVIKDLGVPDSDVLVRSVVLINHARVHLVQYFQAFCDSSKDCVLAIEVLHSLTECHVKLRAIFVGFLVRHGNCALRIMLQPW